MIALLLGCHHPDIAIRPVAAARCEAGAPCEAVVRVATGPTFHLNRDYPARFERSAGPELAEAQPDFTFEDDRRGAQVVRLRAGSPGEVPLEGALKVSWCDEEACHIDELPVTIPVVVR